MLTVARGPAVVRAPAPRGPAPARAAVPAHGRAPRDARCHVQDHVLHPKIRRSLIRLHTLIKCLTIILF